MTTPLKSSSNDLAYVKSVKAKYERELMQQPNVVGIGIGLVPKVALPPMAMQRTLGLIVNVSVKPNDPKQIPSELDGVPVTVKETKPIKAL